MDPQAYRHQQVVSALVLSAMLVACAGGVGAQETNPPLRPSEIPADRPQYLPPASDEGFTLPPVPSAPPAALPGGVPTEIRSFVFDGNTVIGEAELRAVANPFIGKPVTPADLEELRHRITRLYVSRGYINSGALIPEAAYRDGVFRFQIVEGRVSAVRLKGQERLREGYLTERLVRRHDEVLNVNTLQDRFRLLLADPLIENMNARVVPGAELGQALLEVDVTRARPYQLSVFANNYRPPSVGSEALGLTGAVWNLTSLGDVLDVTALKSEGSDRINLGWSVPLPSWRTVLNLRYDKGDASLIEEPLRHIDVDSKIESLEIGLSHPVIDTLEQRLAVGLSWARRENRTTLLGEPFSFIPGEPEGISRLYVWRFFQEYAHRWATQVLALRSTFSFGHNNIPSAIDSRFGAPAHEFLVWLGQAQYARRVTEKGAQLVLKATVQESGDRLLPLERIAVGGVATVRGYRENQLVRDTGYVGSVEIHFPVVGPPDSPHTVNLIPFVDFGSARNKGEARDYLFAAGLGVTWRFKGLSGELFAGKKLKDLPARENGNLQDNGIHFQVRYDLF